MLYDEFVENTGCRQTDYNYQIYKRLELIYMNDNTVTKEEIYEYGKKLVDNSLTKEQLKWNEDIDEQIVEIKQRIESGKDDIERYKANLEWSKGTYFGDDLKAELKFWRRAIKDEQDTIKRLRENIKWLKDCKYV